MISLAVFAALFAFAFLNAEPVLRISIMTDEPPFVVKRKAKPLTEYLGKKMGMKFEFRPVRDADALVAALLAGKLDLVWIDSEHLAQARSLSNGSVTPIVQREDDATFSRPYQWVARSGLDDSLRERLADAFLVMNQDETNGSEFLHYQHTNRYIPALPPAQ